MADSLVECRAGRHYPDRPLAFRWEDRRLEVDDLERQWRSTKGVSYDSPTLYHYRVTTAEGRFDLVYNVQADSWSVTELRESGGARRKD
jgi:hypothetical protein